VITKDTVLSALDYDANTGKFFWLGGKGRKKKGGEAGFLNPAGYRVIGVCGQKVLAHRLVWLVETGSFPAMELDHINRVRNDNRFVNLRQATREQNMRNRGVCKNNKLSMKGVARHQNKYRARIMHCGQIIDLGTFNTAREAAIAYTAAERVCEVFCQIGN
jgi:hypothetical protein